MPGAHRILPANNRKPRPKLQAERCVYGPGIVRVLRGVQIDRCYVPKITKITKMLERDVLRFFSYPLVLLFSTISGANSQQIITLPEPENCPSVAVVKSGDLGAGWKYDYYTDLDNITEVDHLRHVHVNIYLGGKILHMILCTYSKASGDFGARLVAYVYSTDLENRLLNAGYMVESEVESIDRVYVCLSKEEMDCEF
jgi:hypothetical protein